MFSDVSRQKRNSQDKSVDQHCLLSLLTESTDQLKIPAGFSHPDVSKQFLWFPIRGFDLVRTNYVLTMFWTSVMHTILTEFCVFLIAYILDHWLLLLWKHLFYNLSFFFFLVKTVFIDSLKIMDQKKNNEFIFFCGTKWFLCILNEMMLEMLPWQNTRQYLLCKSFRNHWVPVVIEEIKSVIFSVIFIIWNLLICFKAVTYWTICNL